ncbi:hypothetical protein [Psychromonas ossibalaenae]|uniref:hypothetical protein n=1 Tax=Psychromonas ossibalaenae TaxID=444922 RepID=UPI0003785C14|nr:hypothetical protein [Psychromonas ossibalaenae]
MNPFKNTAIASAITLSFISLPSYSNSLYMVSANYSGNTVSQLSLETNTLNELFVLDSASAIDEANGTLYTLVTTPGLASIYTSDLNGDDFQFYNQLHIQSSQIKVDAQTEDIYMSSTLNGWIAIVPEPGVTGGEDDIIFDPISEECWGHCMLEAMAISQTEQKLYYSSRLGEEAIIESVNLGDHVSVSGEVVLTVEDGFKPSEYMPAKDMEYDEKKSTLYWSNDNYIQKLNVDNGKVKDLYEISAGRISAMTVDFEGKKIYWAENEELYSSNLEGKNIRLVLTHDENIISLAAVSEEK